MYISPIYSYWKLQLEIIKIGIISVQLSIFFFFFKYSLIVTYAYDDKE